MASLPHANFRGISLAAPCQALPGGGYGDTRETEPLHADRLGCFRLTAVKMHPLLVE